MTESHQAAWYESERPMLFRSDSQLLDFSAPDPPHSSLARLARLARAASRLHGGIEGFLEDLAMVRSMLKTALATAAFGLIHNALASRPARRAAEHVLGQRARNGLYRPLYIAQSIVTTAALTTYVRQLPDRELYRARGPLALLMRSGQVAGLAYMAWAAREVGLRRLTGLEGLGAYAAGEVEVPPEVEAQGPAPGTGGAMRATGPFRHSRHPLNLSPLPVFWLQPRMIANLLAFNLVATAYLALGSKHEELRLRAAYGRAYEDYRQSGVPFYLPGPGVGHTDGDAMKPLEAGDRRGLPGVAGQRPDERHGRRGAFPT